MNAIGYTLSVLCLPITGLGLAVKWVRRGRGKR